MSGTSAACSTTYQSTDDYEQYAYDAAGNITDHRLRDGTEIDNTYDDLNRITFRDAPGTTNDVTYAYDNNGLRTSESVPSHAMTYTYDALGRLTEKKYNAGFPVQYEYDAASRLTELTHPDGFEVDYTWDTAGNPKTASANSTTLATVTYDDLQRRASVDYGNGADSSYAYDAASRLTDLDWDVNGTADDITYDLTYNPAWQVITLAATPSAMNWAAPANSTDSYTVNGLNQYTAIAGQTITHDKRGNITTDHRGRTYTYDIDNRLLTIASLASGTATYAYYPEGNLRQKSYNSTVSKFYYDDTQEIYETDGSNSKLRRYIRLPGSTDEPFLMIDYTLDGACTNTSFANCEVWAHQDQRNSVVTTTDDNGDVVDVYTYASYGSSGTEGDAGFPFRFTGQKLDADAGLYYYKARWYDPATGRFMQTDPIWYEDFTNLYAYVGNDPVNYSDPTGLSDEIIFDDIAEMAANAYQDFRDAVKVAVTAEGFDAVAANQDLRESAFAVAGTSTASGYLEATDDVATVMITSGGSQALARGLSATGKTGDLASMAQNLANSAKGTHRGGAASAAVSQDGKVVTSLSNRGQIGFARNPTVTRTAQSAKNAPGYAGNCSECGATSAILNSGSSPYGAAIATARVGSGNLIGPCAGCNAVMTRFNMTVIGP